MVDSVKESKSTIQVVKKEVSVAVTNQPATVSRKRRPSALSLKKIHNKLTDLDQVNTDEDYNNKPKENFSEIQLIEKWKIFGSLLKQQGELNMFSIVNANRPELTKEGVLFVLPNKLMEEQFGGIRSKLVNYLRKELNNYAIQIKTKVVESEKKKYIYTPQDKFKKLVESNSSILLLKNTFGLDI